MQLQIGFPDTFPLHGIERDAFEAKLRDALHDVFDGRRVRQLVEQVDARRPFGPSDVLPLHRIGDGHTFGQCMTPGRCRFDDMSMALRHMVMHAISARLGLELAEPGIAAGIASPDPDATNRPPKHPGLTAPGPDRPRCFCNRSSHSSGGAGDGDHHLEDRPSGGYYGTDGGDGCPHYARADVARRGEQRA